MWMQRNDYGYCMIMVSISHKDYEHFAIKYNEATKELQLPARIALRDSNRALISNNHAIDFKIIIKDSSKASGCAAATVSKRKEARAEYTIAFPDGTDFDSVYIPQVIETALDDTTLSAECVPYYSLHVFSNADNDFIPFDQMLVKFVETLGRPLRSDVYFNYEQGEFDGHFANGDIEGLKSLFFQNNEYKMRFQVRTIMPGSTTQGINAQLAAIPTAEFAIKVIETTEADLCKDHDIRWNEITSTTKSERKSQAGAFS
jgi:hypothetical protein